MVEDHSCVALQAALRMAIGPGDMAARTAAGDYFPPVVPPREEDEE